MLARGRVTNGVVVLDDDIGLPEGTPVIVWPETVSPQAAARTGQEKDRISVEERRRVLEIMDRIASLPIEGKTDPFSARDHDKVLYGKP